MATKRLIDANALLERLADSSESWAKNLQAIRKWWPHAVGIKDNIVRLIKDAPTVDAVEVVHGEWTIIKDDYCGLIGLECSECEITWWFEDESSFGKCHYCPGCGAKMDGGVKNA